MIHMFNSRAGPELALTAQRVTTTSITNPELPHHVKHESAKSKIRDLLFSDPF